ncbi:MAG: type VII toxin-antitoxin system HepT family RNase toxin [Actinomycetota bacterium]
MVRPEVVRRKLSLLTRYLGELEVHRNVSLEDYLAGGDRLRAIERLLQVIVEAAAGINTHLATELEAAPPTDYGDSFRAAVRCGIIPAELGERLRPSAGLRNALVHQYGGIDDVRVHASIPLGLDGFSAYTQAVTQWLDRAERTS